MASGLECTVTCSRPRVLALSSMAAMIELPIWAEGLEIGRFVEPWPLLQERTRVPNGNPYYVDLIFQRNGPMRPALGLGGYTTPVEGLFLSGGGTHPGPSVSGAPGQIAAAKVLGTVKEFRGRTPRVAMPPSAPATALPEAVGAPR